MLETVLDYGLDYGWLVLGFYTVTKVTGLVRHYILHRSLDRKATRSIG